MRLSNVLAYLVIAGVLGWFIRPRLDRTWFIFIASPLLVLAANLVAVGWRVTINPPDGLDAIFSVVIATVLWLTLSRRGKVLLLAAFGGSKYKERTFDHQLFRALSPIRGSVRPSDGEARTAQAIENDRQRAISALATLAPPTAEWGRVRDDYVGLLQDEIDAAAQGKNLGDSDDFRSRSAKISARVQELRTAYAFGEPPNRSGT